MGFISDIFSKPSPQPPPVPDYSGAARAQGAANVETARAQNYMNNPNVYGPLGAQTVTFGANDQPTVYQSLTPDALATLQSQQGVQRSLANLGQQGIGTAQRIMGTPFQPTDAGVQTNLGGFQGIASDPNLAGYGQAGSNINAGPIAQGPAAGLYGLQQGGVQGPSLSSQIDTSGIARMPINAGMTGQEAIMARLQPQIERQQKATAQNLANQGLVSGGEAYTNAMRDQAMQQNDLLSQAALQGINLDMGANAQGFGQAATQGQFGNQAQLAGFGANLQNQQAQNQAAMANFGQAQAAQQAQNAAQQQSYGQQVGNVGLQNQAIAQNQNAALQQQQALNAAQTQQFNQALQSGQFSNVARQQLLAAQLQLRNQPLNEITGLMSGSQIQMPQFQGYGGSNIAPPPIFGATQAAGQAAMNQYGIQQAGVNAQNAGLYGLLGGGATLGLMPGGFLR